MALFSLSIEELRARQSLKWRTYDPDVLPLWVAEMDTTMPEPAKAALLDAVERGDTGYPHGTAYAEAFARMAADRWDWQLDASAQVRRAGDVMNSVLAVLDATSEPGDAVVINPPVYPPFRQVIAGYRRRIVEAPLDPAGRLDLASLEAAFAGPEQPKTYLLCSPHNPTGAVHTEAELTAVMALAGRYGVRVVVDEIHACLVDPGTTFVPLLTVPGGEQAISVTSAGKAWNLAGFKAGLIIAGAAVTGVLVATAAAGPAVQRPPGQPRAHRCDHRRAGLDRRAGGRDRRQQGAAGRPSSPASCPRPATPRPRAPTSPGWTARTSGWPTRRATSSRSDGWPSPPA